MNIFAAFSSSFCNIFQKITFYIYVMLQLFASSALQVSLILNMSLFLDSYFVSSDIYDIFFLIKVFKSITYRHSEFHWYKFPSCL